MLLWLAALLLVSDPSPAQATDRVTNPQWTSRPNGEDVAAAYPSKAARRGLPGRGTADCIITPEGRLAECKVRDVLPAGQDFEDGVLKLTKLFKMKSRDAEGALVAGRAIFVPFRLEPPGYDGSLFKVFMCYGALAAIAEPDAETKATQELARQRLTSYLARSGVEAPDIETSFQTARAMADNRGLTPKTSCGG
jgi:protein TonB